MREQQKSSVIFLFCLTEENKDDNNHMIIKMKHYWNIKNKYIDGQTKEDVQIEIDLICLVKTMVQYALIPNIAYWKIITNIGQSLVVVSRGLLGYHSN